MNKTDVLRKMVEQDPDNTSVWYLLGVEYSEQGDVQEALHAYTKALAGCDEELKAKIIAELSRLTVQPTQKVKSEPIQVQSEPSEGMGIEPMRVIEGGKSKHSSQENREQVVTFAEVGGLSQVKDAIRMKIIKPFVSPGLFEKFRKKAGGGILLYGPPGCGKTYIARATAGECRARFTVVHITDILDPYIGVSEQNIKDIFMSARSHKPGILFLDELDAIGYNRSKSSSMTMRTVIDQLLVEIDGIDTNTDKMLVMGATNMPWDVDPAFKRPGRFDRMIFVSPPDREAREVIFRLKMGDRPVGVIDYATLASLTELYSGADIENVVETATEYVLDEIMRTGVERPIQMKDLKEAITRTQPSTMEWLRTVRNYVKYANQSGLYNDVESYLSQHSKTLR
ncbi:AAA family ATPase [Aneurinibacillus uraniidurans]|uniref:AAA family ATPase n=1 Tax=Aneurinibacillus uraniidurans TaxID=2966586 RepID=UPI002349570E|nr:AAA family ATPase [Aneurinibacillus sp. B1]WCN37958.1 AAA family ATPase [Aneurinibacillus sp. B1]